MKTPLLAAQHTKTEAGDHGLNHDGDAIVIWLQLAFETVSGRIPSGAAALARYRARAFDRRNTTTEIRLTIQI
jgi:hypothetical protein